MSDGAKTNPTLKRIHQEIRELSKDQSDQFVAQAFEDNVFEWHFVIRGAPDTDFAGGLYHGRIILPASYPFRPPEFLFLTPNGRFQTNVKICLSISSYHPEQWQPSWNIRTALTAIIAFMPTPGGGAVGALDYPSGDRRALATQSRDFIPTTQNAQRSEQMAAMHCQLRERNAAVRVVPKLSGARATNLEATAAVKHSYPTPSTSIQAQSATTLAKDPKVAMAAAEPSHSAQVKQDANSGTGAARAKQTHQVGANSGVQQRRAVSYASRVPRASEGQNAEHGAPREESDRLGVTAVCLGILLAALILKKVIRSWALGEPAQEIEL